MNENHQTTINQRLSILVDELERGSKAAFANKIGVAVQSIHDLIGGRKGMPSFKVVSSILEQYPTVDANWLIMGQGRMLRDGPIAVEAELAMLTQEYIYLTKQLEGRKAAYREAANDLAQLRAEVQHQQAGLRVEMEHLLNFNKEGQAIMKEIIQSRQDEIKHAQERYAAFLPLHEQAETELLQTHKQQAEVEARINKIILPE